MKTLILRSLKPRGHTSLSKLLVEASESREKLRHSQRVSDLSQGLQALHDAHCFNLAGHLIAGAASPFEVYACQVLTVYWLASGNEIPWCRASEMCFRPKTQASR